MVGILKKIPRFIIGSIVTLLLVVVYFTVVLLTSLVARVVRKEFMFTKWVKKKSYWKAMDLKTQSLDRYHRQF